MDQKFVIVIHAKEDEMAKFAHGLMYAKELTDAGHAVKVIFDGASVKTLAGLTPERPVFKLYEAVKDMGLIDGVCEFCSTVMGVSESALIAELPKLNDANGHAGLVHYITQGYTPITM